MWSDLHKVQGRKRHRGPSFTQPGRERWIVGDKKRLKRRRKIVAERVDLKKTY